MRLPSALLVLLPPALGFATPSRHRRRSHHGPSPRPTPPPSRSRGDDDDGPRAPSRLVARRRRPSTRVYNLYDDWANDLLSSSKSEHTYDEFVLPLDEDSIETCLEELTDSEYGKTMFGKHDVPASVGITGEIEFDSLDGPEAILSLTGKFWHRRETVLGKAAMYLNARIPELTSVRAASPSDLDDFEDVIDDATGAVVGREDKRSPDFNGDRETMEYQGLDPDARGPFVFARGGGMIRPA